MPETSDILTSKVIPSYTAHPLAVYHIMARPTITLFFLSLLAFPATVLANQLSIGTLFQQLKKNESVTIKFAEIRRTRFLSLPETLTGVMKFRPPAYFERKSGSRAMVIDGDQISISSASGNKTLNINESPALQAMVTAFVAPLSGEPDKISNFFSIDLAGTEAAWTLKLKPLSTAVSGYIKSISMTGSNGQILTIETVESNGDTSYITLNP